MRPSNSGTRATEAATAPEVTVMGEQTAFVYTTYIRETPERVWQGLTDRH